MLAACGLSGLIFGLMHLTNLAFLPAPAVIAQVVSATFAGVLLAAIYFRSANIWATVFLHALYDMAGSLGSSPLSQQPNCWDLGSLNVLRSRRTPQDAPCRFLCAGICTVCIIESASLNGQNQTSASQAFCPGGASA